MNSTSVVVSFLVMYLPPSRSILGYSTKPLPPAPSPRRRGGAVVPFRPLSASGRGSGGGVLSRSTVPRRFMGRFATCPSAAPPHQLLSAAQLAGILAKSGRSDWIFSSPHVHSAGQACRYSL